MAKAKIILILIAFLVFTQANAFDFLYKGTPGSIDDGMKAKIDTLIERKMGTPQIRLKYFNALKKYDVNRLAANKVGLFYYLMLKLDPIKRNIPTVKTDKAAQPNIPTTPSSSVTSTPVVSSSNENIQQEPINNPIIPPVAQSSSVPRQISNSYLSETEKLYVETLRKNVREYVEINDSYEFAEYSKTFRVNLKEFYPVDYSNPLKAYVQIPTLGKELLYKKGGAYFITSGGYSFEQKQSIADIATKAKIAAISNDAVVFNSKGGYYYAYTFYDFKYYTIPDTGIYLSQYNGIDSLSNIVLIKKGAEYLIIAKYGEHKLFPTSFLSKIKNPLEVLTAIGKDIYFYKGSDIEETMKSIQSKTNEITSGLQTEDQKISAIYSWITKNLSYDEYSKSFVQGKIDEKTYLSSVDNNVFTGLGSFNSKNSVCDGYSKLFLYMLGFAGVEGIKVETGKGDIGGGKTIAHAWNRIGSKLYDSTWDTYSLGDSSKYKWFALSEQEFYKTHSVEN